MFTLNLSRSRKDEGTLVDQIVSSIEQELRQGTYPAGTALPSVRALAKNHNLSTYTVSEAYQRLVSLGLVIARAGAGYRVATPAAKAPATSAWSAPSPLDEIRYVLSMRLMASIWMSLSGLNGFVECLNRSV